MGRSTVRAQYFALRFRPDTPHSAALPDEPSPGPNTFGAQRTVHSARAAVAANPSVSALFVHRLDARGSASFFDVSSLRRIVPSTYRPFDVSSLRSAVPQGHCAERTARRKQYCVCTVLFRCGGATLVRLTRGGSNQRPRSRLIATLCSRARWRSILAAAPSFAWERGRSQTSNAPRACTRFSRCAARSKSGSDAEG